MFGREYFRAGQVIIDAGIGFIDGKLCGDADFNALEGLDVEITRFPAASAAYLRADTRKSAQARRNPGRGVSTIGWDIGGANIKAARVEEAVSSRRRSASARRIWASSTSNKPFATRWPSSARAGVTPSP